MRKVLIVAHLILSFTPAVYYLTFLTYFLRAGMVMLLQGPPRFLKHNQLHFDIHESIVMYMLMFTLFSLVLYPILTIVLYIMYRQVYAKDILIYYVGIAANVLLVFSPLGAWFAG